MASKHPVGMKVPVRPAPAPPPGRSYFQKVSTASRPMSNLMGDWDLSFVDNVSNNVMVHSTQHPANQTKKVPPPRPPPPKIIVGSPSTKHIKHPSKPLKSSSKQVSSRPSELLTNLFSRRGQKAEHVGLPPPLGILNRGAAPNIASAPAAVVTASLIDLSSPPSSPTPTTRSSSDGLSVDSFGSDGTTSHSHHHSQVESGFEDDSDLFTGFTATPSPTQRDPWNSQSSMSSDLFSPVNPAASVSSTKNQLAPSPQDPFSPPRRNNSPSPLPQPQHIVPTPGVLAFKPTIIRPKVKPNSSPSLPRAKALPHPMSVLEDNEGDGRSESPPMPSIPPPAPPIEILSEAACDIESKSNGETNIGPHCVGIFDFEASQPDDLSFKEGDIIELLRQVNDDWLYGRCCNKEGMFPANFVEVLSPLNDTGGGAVATVMYNFNAQTWEDLDLQEGSKVRLLGRINTDWLYGDCNGKQGQFPASFIDYVPPNLPMHFS